MHSVIKRMSTIFCRPKIAKSAQFGNSNRNPGYNRPLKKLGTSCDFAFFFLYYVQGGDTWSSHARGYFIGEFWGYFVDKTKFLLWDIWTLEYAPRINLVPRYHTSPGNASTPVGSFLAA